MPTPESNSSSPRRQGQPPTAPPRRPRLRLAVLLTCLAAALLAVWSERAGLWEPLDPPPFQGKLELAHGVVIEQRDLLRPSARLMVARIPRKAGLGLRALHLNPEQQELRRLGPTAESLGALVAVNGDYHRLSGPCFATTYSTLIDEGSAAVVGSPFSYAASFWIDREGGPQIGELDLGCALLLPDGSELPLFVNLASPPTLIDRPPSGAWSKPGHVGLGIVGSLERGSFQVSSRLREQLRGQAILVKSGSPEAARLGTLKPGQVLTSRLTGAAAGAVALAIGTGPRLLEDGEVHPDARLDSTGWVNRLGRTAIGLSDDALYLVTTLQAPRGGLSMVALAEALRALGCRDALNLDGGPSTSLWAGGRVINVPVKDGDMPVASGLFVVPPGQGVLLD